MDRICNKVFRQLSLLFLMFVMGSTMVLADPVSVAYALNSGASETGNSSVSGLFSVTSMSLNGPNGMTLDGTGTWDNVTYTLIKSTGATLDDRDYVRFMIKPKQGVTFTPASLSFNACRMGTDATRFKVISNGTTLTADGLSNAEVKPGRNKADNVDDGYTFTYTISNTECTNASPCLIDVYITNGAGKSLGLNDLVVQGTYSGTPVDLSVNDFEAILNDQTGTLVESSEQVQGTALSFGVAHDGTRVASNDPTAVGVISGNYHSDHGLTNLNVTAKVLGPVRISVGQCTYSTNTIVVKNSSGETVATKVPGISCWKNDHSKVTVFYYNGPADEITISGMGYCPYIKVENVDVSEIPTTVQFSFDKGDATGNAPATEEVSIGSNYSLPLNRTLYKEGYTLTGWSDGTTVYAPGDVYTVGDVNVEFIPVFTENTKSLDDRTVDVVLTYSFGLSAGTPAVGWERKADQPLVIQAAVAGETIDVPMIINTESGKFYNIGRNDNAQVNNGTVMTVPSCKNATIELKASNNITSTTINGTLDYTSGKTISSTVSSVASTAIVTIGDGSYYEYVRVTLPALAPEFTSNLSQNYLVKTSVGKRLIVAVDNATSYQWYTATDANKTDEQPIAGETNPSYEFVSNVTGTYYIYCKATNVVGTVSSNVATITVSDDVHTFDFTKWSASTIENLKADADVWNTNRQGTNAAAVANPNTDTDNDGVNDTYVMGGAWTNNVSDSTLKANGSIIPETFGLLFDVPLTGNASAIIYDQLIDYTSMEGVYANQGAQYLQPGGNKGFVIPNVRVGSTLGFKIESHRFDRSRGINLFLENADGVNLTKATAAGNITNGTTGTNEMDSWMPYTYSTPSLAVTSDLVGNADYVDIYVQPSAVMHIYYVDAEMALGLASSTLKMNPGDTYTLTEGRDYFAGTGGGDITFASADPAIATIDATGKITSVASGTVNITVTRDASGDYPAHTETLVLTVDELGSITYDKDGAVGMYPTTSVDLECNKGTVVNLPASPNRLLYKDGYTITGWTDGTDEYEFGAPYTINGDVTIRPVFRTNTKALDEIISPVSVTWYFGKPNGAPAVTWQTSNSNYLVSQATVSGETQDVAVKIVGGKFDNAGRSDVLAQVNGGTAFTFAAVPGMTIRFECASNYTPSGTVSASDLEATAMTVDGVNMTYKYNGTADEITATVTGGSYYVSVSVDYPPLPSFEVQPTATSTIRQGRSKALTVEAANATSYQWYSNTTNSNTGGTAIAGATSDTYAFSAYTETTPGTYYFYCVASNAVGSATSDVAAITVTTLSANHTYDFTQWGSEGVEARNADTDYWNVWEKSDGTGAQGGHYNKSELKDVKLVAGEEYVEETYPLSFTSSAYGIGLINNLASTSVGTYSGSMYLWMTNANSYLVVPNVKTGTVMNLGVESHDASASNGFTVYYGDAATDTWTQIGVALTASEFAEKTVDVPTLNADYTDIKIQSTGSSHLYYIDCKNSDFVALNNEILVAPSTTYTIQNGVDYSTASSAAVTYSIADTDIASVSSKGIITANKLGTTTLTMTQAATGELPAISKNVTIKVLNQSDLTSLVLVSGKEIVEGNTYALTKDKDYTTSSTGAITYTSSDETVATVTETGSVAVTGIGEAYITLSQETSSEYMPGKIRILVVGTPASDLPEITQNIADSMTVYTYTTSKLALKVKNATSYQWYTCDDVQMTNSVAIENATSSVYSFRETNEKTAYYYCVASNSQGRIVSEVCKVKAVRRMYWSLDMEEDISNVIESTAGGGYFESVKAENDGRYFSVPSLNYEEVKLTSDEYLSTMEGLLVYAPVKQVIVYKYTDARSEYVTFNTGGMAIKIPGCYKDEIVKFKVSRASGKNTNIQIKDDSNLMFVEDEVSKLDTTINISSIKSPAESGQPAEFKFTVREDGDVILFMSKANIHEITINSARAVVECKYSVKAVASNNEGNVLKTYVDNASDWTNATIKVPYSYWLKDAADNKLYSFGVKGATFAQNFDLISDTTFLMKYTDTGIEHVVYLSEAENISGATACTNANAAIRSSMCKAAYCTTENGIKVTTLSQGSYRIRAVLFDPQKTANSVHSFRVGKQVVDLVATSTNWTEVESDLIEVTEDGTSVYWLPTENTQCGIDILAIYDTTLPKAEAPTITLNDDDYTFTLTTTEENAELYYTLDGTIPTKRNGVLYEDTPVRLSSNATIMAVTVASEKQTSSPAVAITEYTDYKLTAEAMPKTYGAVVMTPESSSGRYLPGTQVTLRAIAKTGYGFIGWTNTKDGDAVSEEFVHTITMTTDDAANTYYAQFRKGEEGTVVYDLKHAIVVSPDNRILMPSGEFYDMGGYDEILGADVFPESTVSTAISVPTGYTLFYNLGTLEYWIDASTDDTDTGWDLSNYTVYDESKYTIYRNGENKLFEQEGQQLVLRPVFRTVNDSWTASIKENVVHMRNKQSEVTWDFRTGYGAQHIEIPSGVKDLHYSTHAVMNTVDFTDITVDVPLIINTENVAKSTGIDNTDIDTWCTMTEGTKITVPSGYGAVYSLVTYAPINEVSGTTINGKMPDNIYDENIKRTFDGGYIYTWTVNENGNTAELEIGNDYSYYQTLKAVLPSSATKELFFSSNNVGMGRVTTDTDPIAVLSDGGYSYINGSTVNLISNRSHFYELQYWIDDEGSKFYPDNHWEDSTGVNRGTLQGQRPYNGDILFTKVTPDTISIKLERVYSIQAVYGKKTSYYVDFSAGGQAGLPPYQQHVEWDEKFVMPSHNQHLYKEGYTLDYYYDEDDPTKHYEFGKSYLTDKNLLLMPHFKENMKSLGDLTAATTVTWPLAYNEGSTEIAFSRSAGLIVEQLHFDGDSIDLPLYIDGNSGSAINTADSAYCDVRSGCVMTVPTMAGCVISLNATNGNFVNTTIAGSSSQNSGSATNYTVDKTVAVTYNGTNAQEDIRFRENRNCTWVKVTYPLLSDKPKLASVSIGGVPLSDEELNTLITTGTLTGKTATPNYTLNTLGNVTAAATNGGTVSVTQATPDDRNATLIVNTAGGVTVGTYSISLEVVSAESPELKSVTVAGSAATADGTTTVNNVSTSGVISLTFNHAMRDVALGSSQHGLTTSETDNVVNGVGAITSVGGNNVYKLNLTYWNVPVGENTLLIPANTLKDAYGTAYPNDITVKFTAVARKVATDRVFDFVVTHKQTWDAETQTAGERIQTVENDVLARLDTLGVKYGTLDEGVALANSSNSAQRFYIFVPDGEYCMRGNQVWNNTYNDTKKGNNQGLKVENYYNGVTCITRDNLSIIGESMDKTIVYNDPFIYGITLTSTMEVRNMKKDTYFQDFTIDNRYSKYQVDRGDGNPGGQAVAVYDRGIHTIFKNVAMKGYQDTYASASSNGGSSGFYHAYRYYEDCQVWGTVDFLCGAGDSWWERPTLVLRKRDTGNNIVAASTIHTNISKNFTGADYMFDDKWGFVFNHGVVKAESAAAYAKQSGKFTIARTWQNSPANTYLYTKFDIPCSDVGYSNMSQGLVCRMHEYGSMNADGTDMDLTKRTLRPSTPAAGSDDCILTKEQADQFTLHNVLGGDDAYDPTIYTKQVSMANSNPRNSSTDNGDCVIVWDSAEDALCYFIFRIDEATGDTLFYTMATKNSFKPGDDQNGRKFVIRAANERGGLGEPSEIVVYDLLDTYNVSVSEVGSVSGMGWSTVCLPVDATFPSSITVYAAVKAEKTTLKLKKVSNLTGIKANNGYIVYAQAPATYSFRGIHRNSGVVGESSVLEGNPEDHAVSVGTLNIYTLAYKPEISSEVGFYKFTGQTIPAHKAYLTVEYLESLGIVFDTNAKAGLSFFFGEDEEFDEEVTGVDGVAEDADDDQDVIYDLSGKQVTESQMRRGQIYIIRGEKKVWDGK